MIILIIGGTLFRVFLLKKEETKMEEKFEENLPKRKPAVAGSFYPADKEELEKLIDQLLSQAQPPETEGEILALILPHAGYQFSGRTSAHGFKKLIGEKIDTVILIGNSHQESFDGISVFPEGYFETPLGKVKIDSDLAKAIISESDRIFFRESCHKKEHSLEVQLPFLQKVLGDFKIVPILFGNVPGNDYQILANAILKHIKGKNVLVVASSDLSHYPPYDIANFADKKTIEAILSGDVGVFEKTILELEREKLPQTLTLACAQDAIKTVMIVAKELGAKKIELLKYENSGDVSGEKLQVVGYAAIGFFGVRRGNLLNKKEREILLKIARETVESFVKEGKIPEYEIKEPMLNQNLGAFVTIKKQGNLRGCIGRFSPTDIPLFKVVSQMAIAAATEDPRFFPVQKEELPYLKYEISVLTEPREIDDWRKIEIGKHGVIIVYQGRQGVFLPQVATEHNLNLEEFLSLLCTEKVGAEPDCYKKKEAKIFVFEAQVFGEE